MISIPTIKADGSKTMVDFAVANFKGVIFNTIYAGIVVALLICSCSAMQELGEYAKGVEAAKRDWDRELAVHYIESPLQEEVIDGIRVVWFIDKTTKLRNVYRKGIKGDKLMGYNAQVAKLIGENGFPKWSIDSNLKLDDFVAILENENPKTVVSIPFESQSISISESRIKDHVVVRDDEKSQTVYCERGVVRHWRLEPAQLQIVQIDEWAGIYSEDGTIIAAVSKLQ